jgi:putative FmdB family regulatory protein
MPVYNYTCEDCGDFELFRSIEERNHAATCPVCSGTAERFIVAPNLALMNRNVRFAHATNERSRHEPRLSTGGPAAMDAEMAPKRRRGHTCSSGCHHGPAGSKGVRQKRYVETKLGKLQAQKQSARPWMLGH